MPYFVRDYSLLSSNPKLLIFEKIQLLKDYVLDTTRKLFNLTILYFEENIFNKLS